MVNGKFVVVEECVVEFEKSLKKAEKELEKIIVVLFVDVVEF